MANSSSGQLASYNSLTDPHLRGYFSSERLRKHLISSGLVTRRGYIVNEQEYRKKHSRRERQRHVRDLLAQAIVQKTLDMERHRQAKIRYRLEEISKIETVRRIKAERSIRGDDDILPYLTSSSRRSRSVNDRRSARSREKGDDGDIVYLDAEGNVYNNNKAKEKRSNRHRRGDSDYHDESTVTTRSQQSAGKSRVSAKSRYRKGKSLTSLRRSFSPVEQMRSNVEMKFTFRGVGLEKIATDKTSGYHVIIEQQHCGGNTVTLLNKYLDAGDQFVITSKRHIGYPLGLTFYINGTTDAVLSACCESPYRIGTRVGGKSGHFVLNSLKNARPCFKCDVKRRTEKKDDVGRKSPDNPGTDAIVPIQDSDDAEEYEDDFDNSSIENNEKESSNVKKNSVSTQGRKNHNKISRSESIESSPGIESKSEGKKSKNKKSHRRSSPSTRHTSSADSEVEEISVSSDSKSELVKKKRGSGLFNGVFKKNSSRKSSDASTSSKSSKPSGSQKKFSFASFTRRFSKQEEPHKEQGSNHLESCETIENDPKKSNENSERLKYKKNESDATSVRTSTSVSRKTSSEGSSFLDKDSVGKHAQLSKQRNLSSRDSDGENSKNTNLKGESNVSDGKSIRKTSFSKHNQSSVTNSISGRGFEENIPIHTKLGITSEASSSSNSNMVSKRKISSDSSVVSEKRKADNPHAIIRPKSSFRRVSDISKNSSSKENRTEDENTSSKSISSSSISSPIPNERLLNKEKHILPVNGLSETGNNIISAVQKGRDGIEHEGKESKAINFKQSSVVSRAFDSDSTNDTISSLNESTTNRKKHKSNEGKDEPHTPTSNDSSDMSEKVDSRNLKLNPFDNRKIIESHVIPASIGNRAESSTLSSARKLVKENYASDFDETDDALNKKDNSSKIEDKDDDTVDSSSDSESSTERSEAEVTKPTRKFKTSTSSHVHDDSSNSNSENTSTSSKSDRKKASYHSSQTSDVSDSDTAKNTPKDQKNEGASGCDDHR